MRITIYITTILLILSSCATSNYGKLKYSKISNDYSQEAELNHNTENNEENSYVNEEKIADIEHRVIIETLENTIQDDREKTQIDTKKRNKYTSLRDKLNRIQTDQLKEINAIHNQNKDTISEKKKNDPTRVERRALLYGWLSFIPIPVIGWIFSILAITYGAIALNRLKKGSYVGSRKKALIGMLLGIFTLFVWLIVILLFFASI